jgi:hypothetical protein
MSYNITLTITNLNPDGTEEIYQLPVSTESVGFFEGQELFSIPSIEPHEDFGNKEVVLVKKSTYNEAQRLAQKKYREKYPEKYCKVQRDLYHNKKQDEEWRMKFNERSKLNNRKYREKKKEEMKALGIEIKGRGRPRKVIPEDPVSEI